MNRATSQAAMWGEWFSAGPLLIYMTVSSIHKKELHRIDIITIVTFFFSLFFGFLPVIPQPYWLALVWLVLSFISFLPSLYLPFHIFNESRLESDLENQKLAEAQRKKIHLSLWLTFALQLYPANYLLSMFHVVDGETTLGVYFLLTLLTKGLYSTIAMDVHSDALIEAEYALNEEKSANEARRAFLKYIFHEVRTPLNSLTMGIELLLQRESPNSSSMELLSMMRSASDFMADTLNDVLSLQKMEEGKLELERSPFSIRSSVDKVLSTFLGASLSKKITMTKTISDDVPDRLIGDRYRIEHVLGNLLSNAIKFSPFDGIVHIKVEMSTTTSSNGNKSNDVANIVTSVSDNGAGISPENQLKLFKSFVQIRPGQLQGGQGSGLGLSLVKQIVNLHGGTVWVESVEGQGSTFSFSIPFTVYEGTENGKSPANPVDCSPYGEVSPSGLLLEVESGLAKTTATWCAGEFDSLAKKR